MILPGGTDDKFLQKINQIFDESSATKSKYFIRNRKKQKEFIIRHFAGDVGYSCDNFLDKNKDSLVSGIVKLINSSSIEFIRSPDSAFEASNVSNVSNALAPAGTPKNLTRLTLCSKFKLDLDTLMTALKSTTPYFIRCIKPNDLQVPDRFDSVLTLSQLKYSVRTSYIISLNTSPAYLMSNFDYRAYLKPLLFVNQAMQFVCFTILLLIDINHV